jgi:hypothetical protein
MKGEATRIAHVDSGICIRSEVLHGVICLEVHENGFKKKKKKKRTISNRRKGILSECFHPCISSRLCYHHREAHTRQACMAHATPSLVPLFPSLSLCFPLSLFPSLSLCFPPSLSVSLPLSLFPSLSLCFPPSPFLSLPPPPFLSLPPPSFLSLPPPPFLSLPPPPFLSLPPPPFLSLPPPPFLSLPPPPFLSLPPPPSLSLSPLPLSPFSVWAPLPVSCSLIFMASFNPIIFSFELAFGCPSVITSRV